MCYHQVPNLKCRRGRICFGKIAGRTSPSANLKCRRSCICFGNIAKRTSPSANVISRCNTIHFLLLMGRKCFLEASFGRVCSQTTQKKHNKKNNLLQIVWTHTVPLCNRFFRRVASQNRKCVDTRCTVWSTFRENTRVHGGLTAGQIWKCGAYVQNHKGSLCPSSSATSRPPRSARTSNMLYFYGWKDKRAVLAASGINFVVCYQNRPAGVSSMWKAYD